MGCLVFRPRSALSVYSVTTASLVVARLRIHHSRSFFYRASPFALALSICIYISVSAVGRRLRISFKN